MPHFRAPSRCSTVNFGNMAEGRPQASSQLQWLLLKNWNSFYRKNLNNSRFSAEPGNLYNKHSYKHSGLANEKTIHIEATSDHNIRVVKPNLKKQHQPAKSRTQQDTRKHHSKIAKSLAKETQHTRPDLKAAALARLGRVHQGTRAAKASKKA